MGVFPEGGCGQWLSRLSLGGRWPPEWAVAHRERPAIEHFDLGGVYFPMSATCRFFAVGACVFTFAAASSHGEPERQSEVRRAIFDDFRYDPEFRKAYEEQAAADPQSSIMNDPDTVYLPKFEVEDRPLPRGLAEAVEKSRFAGPQNNTQLGTGIREKDFGKVRASVVTVLYIPIFAGLSW
ncbi:MAG: hypothetical protein QM760_17835 [Nibricoccus sp.]